MRDMNLTYSAFEILYKKQTEKKFLSHQTQNIKILRSAVINNPTFSRDFDLVLPSKFHLIRGLCLIWDYLPESLRFEIQFLLEGKIEKFDSKKKLELKLLFDPETRIQYLYSTKRLTSHEIFGNVIQESITSLFWIQLRRKSTKVKKPQRKRGYDDKGTLRSYDIWCDKWKPSFDWSLTEEQNRKEKKQDLHKKYLELLKNLLRNKL